MKKTIRAQGTFYYRKDGSRKPTTGPFDETVTVDMPASEVSLVSFVQNRVISDILRAKIPGYINWQSCMVSLVEKVTEPFDVQPKPKAKKINLE